MSQQALDLRRSTQTVRRHKRLVGLLAALGFLAAIAYTIVSPPQVSSTSLVVLPNSAPSVATQVVIAQSDPVLSAALPQVSPPVTLTQLRSKIHVKSLTSYILSITAQGKTAADAEATANAVASSYIAYVGLRYSLVGHVVAHTLQRATIAAGPSLPAALASTALIGALVGALIGVIVALVISRSDQRLRDRDDIANSIGVPVLAAVPVGHPADPAGWTRLLENYKPRATDAWQLRTALQQLGIPNKIEYDRSATSIAVLSFSADPKALALGPQLAVFAASQGIATVLALGPQQDTNVTAALRAACATPSKREGNLRVVVSEDGDIHGHLHAGLLITVVVVDAEKPEIAGTARTTATVLGVSPGTTTAEQLAGAAVVVAADGRDVSGIHVADPEPDDRTSGRIARPPQPTRRRQSARSGRLATEIRR